jgi:predicted AlkP superfamily phosphohydrolase/phosphomutase
LLAEQETWHHTMEARISPLWSDAVKEAQAQAAQQKPPIVHAEIDWQPASRYRPFWPDMEVFAMPSFYDGRVRVNLKGRERLGIVTPDRYPRLLDEIKTLLRECTDPITAKAVVAGFSETSKAPLDVGPTESDLYVYWEGLALGFAHPRLGRIGPVPFRRTGGHSGPFGFLYCVHPSLPASDMGEASSFDVMPTLAAILGEAAPAARMSGKPLLP